jgi:hypothetical protein
MDEKTAVLLTLDIEVYLRHREDSLIGRASIPFSLPVVTQGGIPEVMDLATQYIEDEMSRSKKIMFVDERNNIRLFNTEEIQSISLLAPDALPDLTELEENE